MVGLRSLEGTLGKFWVDAERHQESTKALADNKADQANADTKNFYLQKQPSFHDTTYVFVKPLGKGCQGLMRMAKRKSLANQVKHPDDFVAVRTIQRMPVTRGAQKELLFAHEDYATHSRHVQALKDMDHPNIQRVVGAFEDAQEMHVIMELYTGGNLLAKESGPLSEPRAARVVSQIVSAMVHAHERGIVHQDIRPDNIHYASKSSDARVVVTDWSCCEYIATHARASREHIVKSEFSAPELKPTVRTDRGDMWSIGVLAFALVTFKLPFGDHGPRKEASNFKWAAHEAEGYGVSGDFRSLIESLLRFEPMERLSAAAAAQHPWLTKGPEDHVQATSACHTLRFIVSMFEYGRVERLKRLTYCLAAEHLSEDRVASLTRSFAMLDRDKSGFIESKDMKTELLKIIEIEDLHGECADIKGELPEMFDERTRVEELIAVMDPNQEGRVAYSEFLAEAAEAVFIEDRSAAWQAFRALDPSGASTIAKADAIRTLQATSPSHEKVATLYRPSLEVGGEESRTDVSFEEVTHMMGMAP
jgi:calcium-dependent protein kinase